MEKVIKEQNKKVVLESDIISKGIPEDRILVLKVNEYGNSPKVLIVVVCGGRYNVMDIYFSIVLYSYSELKGVFSIPKSEFYLVTPRELSEFIYNNHDGYVG